VRADLQRALNIRGGGLDDALQDDVALGAREPAAEVRGEVCDETDEAVALRQAPLARRAVATSSSATSLSSSEQTTLAR